MLAVSELRPSPGFSGPLIPLAAEGSVQGWKKVEKGGDRLINDHQEEAGTAFKPRLGGWGVGSWREEHYHPLPQTQQSLLLMDWVGKYQLGTYPGKAGPGQSWELSKGSAAAVGIPVEGFCLDCQRGSKTGRWKRASGHI